MKVRDEKYGEMAQNKFLIYLVFPLNVFIYLFVCGGSEGVHMHTWRSEDNLRESAFSSCRF